MATEEWIRKAIENGRLYDELPPRVRQLLPVAEWKNKVKTFCHQRGSRWSESLAVTACGEQEYYEDLIRYFRQSMRVFPYHLADYVCQVLRIMPFKYYCDLLFATMRDELSYDRIPNFTAADIVRVVGIGRNEFISIMNQCKAKKVLWRINKSLAKDFLPTAPLDVPIQPWWIAHVVHFTTVEYDELTPQELKVCRTIFDANGIPAAQLPDDILLSLHRQGLLYLDVPIQPTDHVTIPPLEGFVSNKDMEVGGDKGDPVERLLYLLFVATTDRSDVAALASVLSVELLKLQETVSIACRLGFGINTTACSDPSASTPKRQEAATNPFLLDFSEEEGSAHGDAAKEGEGSIASPVAQNSTSALAVVVDAEVTSFLMMGAMSPGLKRHSVSLFEGGRVTGHDVITDMIHELHLSVEAGRGFEGEMQRLSGYCSALAMALDTVTAAGGGAAVELLRKESLTSLAPVAAARVLAHSYAAVLPIAPLPFPPLPLSPLLPGPVNFGSSIEASTPWLQLLLYTALRQGPLSLIMPAGQRLWRIPPPLLGATHVVVWSWSPDIVRSESVPLLLPSAFLITHLNDLLTRSALLIQPLHMPDGELRTVDVPLPMVGDIGSMIEGVTKSGEKVQLPPPPRLAQALQQLGLSRSPGFLRFLQVTAPLATLQQHNLPPSAALAEKAGSEVEGKRSIIACAAAASEDGATITSPTAGQAASPHKQISDAFADLLLPAKPQIPVERPLSLADSLSPSGLAHDAELVGPNADLAPTDVVSHEAANGGTFMAEAAGGSSWAPLQLSLGMPLVPEALNRMVCNNALAARFLDSDSLEIHRKGQRGLQQRLLAFIAEFGTCEEAAAATGRMKDDAALTIVDLPLHNLLFDGQRIWQAELTAYLQGVGMLCFD